MLAGSNSDLLLGMNTCLPVSTSKSFALQSHLLSVKTKVMQSKRVGAKTITHSQRSESSGIFFYYFQLYVIDFTQMYSKILI